jgi:5-formaminoimidazole-4-carboxamide-1-beta-D-ribofuranosyl 5'-monophosphate synthetase
MKKIFTGEELIEYAKIISSKEEFEHFLKCLLQDYKENKNEWKNADLSRYLDGLAKFAVDMSGYYANLKEDINVNNITWRIAAEMLLAASVYGN